MTTMISLHDIISLFLAFCGGVSVLGAAAVYIAKAIGWIRKPEVRQDEQLKDHETRITRLEEKTDNDYDDINKLQAEVKMVLKATLAIMKHEIDGNNTADLAKTRDDIEEYLLSK